MGNCTASVGVGELCAGCLFFRDARFGSARFVERAWASALPYLGGYAILEMFAQLCLSTLWIYSPSLIVRIPLGLCELVVRGTAARVDERRLMWRNFLPGTTPFLPCGPCVGTALSSVDCMSKRTYPEDTSRS